MMSLFPLAFSYSGASATTVDLKAPAVSTLRSVACEGETAAPSAPATVNVAQAMMDRLFLMVSSGMAAWADASVRG